MNTDLSVLSPEQKALYQQAAAAVPRPNVQAFDQIKLAQLKKVEGVEMGHYYIERRDGEQTQRQDIGANPNIVILHRAYSYSYYDDKAEKLVAWTSEFVGFTDQNKVWLFSRDGDTARVEKAGSYPDTKKYIKDKYPNAKFRNVLYVLYEGTICRMFVSNASVSGLPQGENKPDFKNPQEGSLLLYMIKASDDQVPVFNFTCELGSQYKDDASVPFYLMTFTLSGENPQWQAALDQYGKLLPELQSNLKSDIERMGESEEHEKAPETPDVIDVDSEDLPF